MPGIRAVSGHGPPTFASSVRDAWLYYGAQRRPPFRRVRQNDDLSPGAAHFLVLLRQLEIRNGFVDELPVSLARTKRTTPRGTDAPRAPHWSSGRNGRSLTQRTNLVPFFLEKFLQTQKIALTRPFFMLRLRTSFGDCFLAPTTKKPTTRKNI